MSNPDLPPDSITTLPYEQRTAAIRERHQAFAYSGPDAAGRERDTAIGHLLDRLEQLQPESWPRDKPMPVYTWGTGSLPCYRQALREYWEAHGIPPQNYADTTGVNEAVEWWNQRAADGGNPRVVHVVRLEGPTSEVFTGPFTGGEADAWIDANRTPAWTMVQVAPLERPAAVPQRERLVHEDPELAAQIREAAAEAEPARARTSGTSRSISTGATDVRGAEDGRYGRGRIAG